MSYLLRVELPDRPGSLGALAVALGAAGADILSLDVVERSGGRVVDDIVVAVERGALPDTLISAAERLPETEVDAIRPFTGILDTHLELELVDRVAGTAAGRMRTLVEEAPRALRAHWAMVVDATSEGGFVLVTGSSAPESRPSAAPWLPLEWATVLNGSADWVPNSWRDADTELAAAPLGNPAMALLLGRSGGPDFRPAEVARLGYLAGILGTVLR